MLKRLIAVVAIQALLMAGPAAAAHAATQQQSVSQTSVTVTSPPGTAGGTAQPMGTGTYEYYCASSWGTYAIVNYKTCPGTVTAYISGSFAWKVNVLRLQARFGINNPPAVINSYHAALQTWCSQNSFDCAIVIGAVLLILGNLIA